MNGIPPEVWDALSRWGTAVMAAVAGFAAALFTRRSAAEANSTTAQNLLIDQLQEELKGYRGQNDARVQRLEKQLEELLAVVGAYRAFIGVQRDHMAEHGIPLPAWPDNLPR